MPQMVHTDQVYNTAARLTRVSPNQPKTRARAIRVDDVLWAAMQEIADENGETVSDVARRAFAREVKAHTRRKKT